jgi:hypothetical protein
MNSVTTYVIYINGRRFEVSQPTLVGAQIRALAGLSADDTLVVEGQGSVPDRLLADSEKVSLAEPPVHVFTKPSTTFGNK